MKGSMRRMSCHLSRSSCLSQKKKESIIPPCCRRCLKNLVTCLANSTALVQRAWLPTLNWGGKSGWHENKQLQDRWQLFHVPPLYLNTCSWLVLLNYKYLDAERVTYSHSVGWWLFINCSSVFSACVCQCGKIVGHDKQFRKFRI